MENAVASEAVPAVRTNTGIPEAENATGHSIEPISTRAPGARFASMVFNSNDRYGAIDDDAAYKFMKTALAQHGLDSTIGIGNFVESYPTSDNYLDLISKPRFGSIAVKDDMTGLIKQIPLLESDEASLIRDRMMVAGIAPLEIHKDQLVIALRVDEASINDPSKIFTSDVNIVIQELKRLIPQLKEKNLSIGIYPVCKKTYDVISTALMDPEYRDMQFIKAADAHFSASALAADFISDCPTLLPLGQMYPSRWIMHIVRSMQFDPFIKVPVNVTKVKTAGDKKESTVSESKTEEISIFETGTESVTFLLGRCKKNGFIPLRIDRDDSNRPSIVLGFKAFAEDSVGILFNAEGGFEKQDWYNVVERLGEFVHSVTSSIGNYFPKDLSRKDFKLVPIPNRQFDFAFEHLSNPTARKITLHIIDRQNGVLNFQQMVSDTVAKGGQELYIQEDRREGVIIRTGIGSMVVKADYTMTVSACRAAIQSAAVQMTSENISYNKPFGGQFKFSGASPDDYAKWDDCFANGVTPPPIPGHENNLNIYPRNLEGISLRLQYNPIEAGHELVIRIHRMQKRPPALAALNLRPEAERGIRYCLGVNSGLFVFDAPTGCGKSTLMASMIEENNVPGRVGRTIEDPIEFIIPGISQSSVNESAGRSRKALLDAALRSAPHFIMVGEIRNLEESQVAMHAGQSGHLVYTTLHANDAPEAMVRFITMGVDPFFISSSLSAVISQRLVPQFRPVKHSLEYRPDPMVVEPYDCREQLEELLGVPGAFEGQPIMTLKAKDSKVESGEAYQGRVPVNEIIVPTPELRALYLRKEGWTMLDLIDTLKKQKDAPVKFEPMVVLAVRWVLDGRTSLDAIVKGEKVIPLEHFRLWKDEIIAAVKEYQQQQSQTTAVH